MYLTYICLLMLHMQYDNTQRLCLSCGVISNMLHNMLKINGYISSVVLSDMNFLYICTVWKYLGTIKCSVTAMHVHWSVYSSTMVENQDYVDLLTLLLLLLLLLLLFIMRSSDPYKATSPLDIEIVISICSYRLSKEPDISLSGNLS